VADNALLKLAPLLEAMGSGQPSWDVTAAPRALLAELGLELDGDPSRSLAAIEQRAPALAPLADAMMRVTFAPTMVDASEQMNVIPAKARLHVDCRVPPRMGEDTVRTRVSEVLGDAGYRLEFTERVMGNASPPRSPLADAIASWVGRVDPGARVLPTLCVGYTDSRAFRDAFPDCVAYGFFPQRHMTLQQLTELVHGRDERIDVRDLGLAVDCYRAVVTELLGEA
jgi:acetylornithine deacetylase/succinyl-diaminopimelate desuccinylase-like protein